MAGFEHGNYPRPSRISTTVGTLAHYYSVRLLLLFLRVDSPEIQAHLLVGFVAKRYAKLTPTMFIWTSIGTFRHGHVIVDRTGHRGFPGSWARNQATINIKMILAGKASSLVCSHSLTLYLHDDRLHLSRLTIFIDRYVMTEPRLKLVVNRHPWSHWLLWNDWLNLSIWALINVQVARLLRT